MGPIWLIPLAVTLVGGVIVGLVLRTVMREARALVRSVRYLNDMRPQLRRLADDGDALADRVTHFRQH